MNGAKYLLDTCFIIIKLPDASILVTAKHHGLTIITLDDKLNKISQLV